MDPEQAIYFRDQLREARARALRDGEGFQHVLLCLERIGETLHDSVLSLGLYRDRLSAIADASPLGATIPRKLSRWHTPFADLYAEFVMARNDAVHQGAYARTLTNHAVALALVLEDALMIEGRMVAQFMVADPVVARGWQPMSFVRQQMLTHAFSYLPLFLDDPAKRGWHLLPEYSVARYLRAAAKKERPTRLATSVDAAVSSGSMVLVPATTIAADTPVEDVLPKLGEWPILVVDGDGPDALRGILTASDLL
jgi:CBS domain-containing protein